MTARSTSRSITDHTAADAADTAVQDYLDRLSAATSTLEPAERSELVQQITDHLAAARADARADGRTDDEALVRNLTDELGTPEQVAAAAGAAPSAQSSPSIAYEAGTTALLAFQWFVVPGLGWIAGVALALCSKKWTGRQKLLATALPLPVLIALLTGRVVIGSADVGVLPVGVIIVVAGVLAIIATAIPARHLLRAARRSR